MTEKKKYLRRAIHDKQNPYLQVKRTTVQDKRLSYEARGMLVYILSQRDDWRVQPAELVITGCGRDKVYRILKELIELKYVEHEKSFDEQHKIVWGDYIVHEYPVSENPDTENQEMDLGEKPYPENPDTENTYINNYSEKEKEKKTRKRGNSFHTSNPNRSEWLKRLEPVEALAHKVLSCLEMGYDQKLFKPHEFMTSVHLEKYIPALEELASMGAIPEEIRPMYKWLKTRYDENGWTVGLKTFIEQYRAYKAAAKKIDRDEQFRAELRELNKAPASDPFNKVTL